MALSRATCTEPGCGKVYTSIHAKQTLINHKRRIHGYQNGRPPEPRDKRDVPMVTMAEPAEPADAGVETLEPVSPRDYLERAIEGIHNRTAALTIEVNRLEKLQGELAVLDAQLEVLIAARQALVDCAKNS